MPPRGSNVSGVQAVSSAPAPCACQAVNLLFCLFVIMLCRFLLLLWLIVLRGSGSCLALPHTSGREGPCVLATERLCRVLVHSCVVSYRPVVKGVFQYTESTGIKLNTQKK